MNVINTQDDIPVALPDIDDDQLFSEAINRRPDFFCPDNGLTYRGGFRKNGSWFGLLHVKESMFKWNQCFIELGLWYIKVYDGENFLEMGLGLMPVKSITLDHRMRISEIKKYGKWYRIKIMEPYNKNGFTSYKTVLKVKSQNKIHMTVWKTYMSRVLEGLDISPPNPFDQVQR